MKRDVDTALDQCLVWLHEGKDVQSCLARYPEYATELRPLLECAAGMGRVISPTASTAARAAGRRRMLTALTQKREREAASHPLARATRVVTRRILLRTTVGTRATWQVAALALMVALLAAGGLVISASTDSLPGEVLYPLKSVSQRVQLALTFNPAKHRLLADQFDTQRRLDIQAVLVAGRQLAVEFQGVVQRMEPELWQVGGLPVSIDGETTIAGEPYLGALVHVRARLPGDGRLIAFSVSVEPTTTPRPTPSLSPTEPARPTATRTPTSTPVVRQTPTPSGTPDSARAPTATEASQAVGEQTPTRAVQAETSAPSEAPAPAGTLEPMAEPKADEAGRDEEGAEPANTPELSGTPEPEETSAREATIGPAETPVSEGQPERERGEEPDVTSEPEGEPAHDEILEPFQTRQPDAGLDHDDESHSGEAPRLDVEPDHDQAPGNDVPPNTGDLSAHSPSPQPPEGSDD
jgi:hypothetical protein